MGDTPRVHIQNRQRGLRIDARAVLALAARVLAAESAGDGRVGVVFVRDRAIAELNARFLGRPGPTDVIAFPTDPTGWPAGEPVWLGEVVVSVDRAREQARERGLRVREELHRLVVHGILHLCGYRDSTPRGRDRMRRREDRYLRPPGRR
jgi:probable rRNA maturation factor